MVASKPNLGANRRGVIVGPGHGDVHDGVERAPAVGAGQLTHVLDDGRTNPAAALLGMDSHGDFDAVRVVEQRELEESDAEDRTVLLGTSGDHGVPLGLAVETGEGADIAQAVAAQFGPEVLVGRRQNGGAFRQCSVVS
jgi:hypothetical protein